MPDLFDELTIQPRDIFDDVAIEKPIGFGEAFIERPLEKVPFSPLGALRIADVVAASKRLTKDTYIRPPIIGEIETQEKYTRARAAGAWVMAPSMDLPKRWEPAKQRARDIRLVDDYINELAEKERRGYTTRGRVGQILSEMPAFAIEFLATGGIKKLASKGAKEYGKKLLGRHAKTKVGRIAIATGGAAVGTAARAAGMPHRAASAIISRQAPQDIKINADGSVNIVNPGEAPMTSVWKGLADHYIEIASEQAGEVIAPFAGKIFKRLPFIGKVTGALQRRWLSLNPNKTVIDFAKQMTTKAGFHGVVSEIGEEYLGDATRAIFDIDDFGAGKDADLYQRLAAAVKADTDNLPAMALAFSVPGAGRMAAGIVAGGRRATYGSIADTHNEQGGSTIDIRTGGPIKKGFAVSPYPERTVKIPGKNVTSRHITGFAKKNQGVLKDPRATIGTWYNEADNTTYLDVTLVEKKKDDAVNLGLEKNQISVFDLENFEEIPTGGTGAPPLGDYEALGYGHAIPEALGMEDEERRAYMESLTGKTSMADMTPEEIDDYLWQLNIDAENEGISLKKLAQEFQPKVELDKQVTSLKRFKPVTVGERRRMGVIEKTARQIGEKVSSYLLNQDRMKQFTRMLDGYEDDGPFTKLIFEPIKTATVRAKDTWTKVMRGIDQSLADADVDLPAMMSNERDDVVDGFPLSDTERIGIYLLSRNKKGYRSIAATFSEEGINAEEAIANVVESVEQNEDELLVANSIQAYFDGTGPRFFETVDALGIKNVPKEENYITMFIQNRDEVEEPDILEALGDYVGGLVSIPGQRHAKARRGTMRKVEWDAAMILTRASKALERFMAVGPTAVKVRDLLKDASLKRDINSATDGKGVKIMQKWLQDAVRGSSDYNPTDVARTIRTLRRNSVIYTLGLKLATVVPKQSLSAWLAVAKRPAMLPSVMKNFSELAKPKIYRQVEQEVFSKSPLVRTRDWERDLKATYRKKDVKRIFAGQNLSPISMKPISWVDRHTVVLVWKSAYDVAKVDGLTETEARGYADNIVQTTQPMADTTDLPGYFRGGEVAKALTTFMNQPNQNFQFLRHDILGELKAAKISRSMAMYRFMFGQMMPAILLGMIVRGRPPETAGEMATDLVSYMMTPMVFFGRFIYNAATGNYDPVSSAVSTMPLRGFEEAGRAVAAVRRGDIRTAAERGVGAVGAFTGKIPQQLITTTGGAIDLLTGETDDMKRLIYTEYMREKYGPGGPEPGAGGPARRR